MFFPRIEGELSMVSPELARVMKAILGDKKKIFPCAAYLEGEYGIDGSFVGVPVKLGSRGIESILQINLTVEERIALRREVR